MEAGAARTFRPYPGVYLRRRDMFVTAWMIVILMIIAIVATREGWSRRDVGLFGGIAFFIIAVRLGTLFIDASLRKHTKYELRDGVLDIHRDGLLVASIPPERLRDLRPKSVDERGMGSADLPHEPLSDFRSVNH